MKNHHNSGKADDGSLEIRSSETEEGLKTYTKQDVEMLLTDRFKGRKCDSKAKQEWTIEYIKRLKVCLKCLQDVVAEKDSLQTALKSQEEELKVTISKLETNISSLSQSLEKEESEKLASLDFLKKEKEKNMALEKNQESLRKELGWAERTVLNANDKVKMQEDMYASLQEYNTHLQDELREAKSQKAVILQQLSSLRAHTPFLQIQDELREANRANKQLQAEKADLLQELLTLRAHNTVLQLQDELREANRANKQLESEKADILQELSTLRTHNTFHAPLNLVVPNPDDALLEMHTNIGSRSTPRTPTNIQIGSSETEGLKMYKKEEVEMLLKERFKGRKCDHKGKQEWMIDYVKRLKVCLKWLEDGVDEKDGLRKMLDSSEIINKPDPFSLLHEDILLDIMARIKKCTTKELIRTTSTISKRWRNLWASVPHLIFLDDEDGVDPDANIRGYISFIDNTINQCPTYPNLKLFKLDTNYTSSHNPEFKSRVNSWIRYAISRNVEEFDLRCWDLGEGEEFTYDDDLFFNSSCITRIKLSWCLLNPPDGAISWGRLQSLFIYCGTLDEDTLEMILSGSPCLGTLKLEDCYGYRRINITSKSVKELVFSGYNSHHEIYRDADYIDCVKINAPYLSSLTIKGELVLRDIALLDVSSLVEADLDYSIDWRGEISHQEILRGLLESLKHVEDITFGDDVFELLSSVEGSSDTSNDDLVENEDQEE